MPREKRQAASRTQSKKDLEFIFDYESGEILQEEIHEEVQRTKELFIQYDSSREPWAQKFQESVHFRAGAQWTKEQQQVLESRGQAPIVVNRIHPIVETAKALLTYNSPQFRSTGREDSDRKTAQVFSDLFQWVWQESGGDMELKQVIDDYYVGGMGVLQAYQDPDKDNGKGEVCLKQLNPLNVYLDPNAKDHFARDAANIIVANYMTDEYAESVYPEYSEIIKNSAEDPDVYDNAPTTNLASTEGQIFDGDQEDRAHTKRRYLERYTKEIHTYYNIFEPFSNREYVYSKDDTDIYRQKMYIRVRKITGEETIIFDNEAVLDIFELIEDGGPVWHYRMPEDQFDEMGNIIPQMPIQVPGEEDENAIPGSTMIFIPTTTEELIGLGEITANAVEVPRIKMVVSVGDKLLYQRILPVGDYPIVHIILYRPLQEYINKIRSLIIAHASTSTNVKLLIPRGSVDKRQVEEEWGRAGTSVIEFDAELGAPIVAGPVPLPNELYKNEADAKYDLEYGFGIYELMQGGASNAPTTYRGTIVVDEFGQRRIKSRRDDIESGLNQLAKVCVPLMQQLYTEEKVIRIVQPNGEETEERFNFYKQMDNEDVIKYHDVGVGKYDIVVVSGSTLPTNRMALLNTYMEMFKMGLIDQTEVLKKSELVDVEGVLQRAGQMQQMAAMIEQLQAELKQVKGDLQTSDREAVHAKKRLEVEKFSSGLDKISNRAEAATSLYQARLNDERKNLMNSNEIKQAKTIFDEDES